MNKIPEILKYLIKEIQEEKSIDASRVVEFMKRTDIKENELTNFINFNHSAKESYGRNIIFDGGFFKLMLMSWNKYDFTAIHDHGQVEWGAVKSFGTVSNIEYSFENNKLKIIKNEILNKGDVTAVTSDLIHQAGNNTDKAVLTMHLYGSDKVKNDIGLNSKIFDTVDNRIIYTTGAAYLKLPSDIIIRKNENLDVDIATFEFDKSVRLNFFNKNKKIFANELYKLNKLNKLNYEYY